MKTISTSKTITPEQRAASWLKGGGLRPTRQRMALAELLIGDGGHRHVTAEGLYAAARGADISVSLATVYNTLHAFSQAGLLRELMVDGAKTRFDTNTTDHPHFFWEDEDRLTDAPTSDLRISGLPDAPEGATISGVDLVIRLRKD
ncbi:MAG: transcriptional repressor [Rhodobacterales bacterium]|nr:MAG: transcriptional repressor [Rhodobacterales bacterium]